MTREDILGRGTTVVRGEHAIWVPEGMTIEEMEAGAGVLERKFAVDTYTARSMTAAVLAAIRQPDAKADDTR